MANPQKPVAEVRIRAVKAIIWKNETQAGIRHNATFSLSRLYKDGDEWKSTTSFGREDLLLLAKVADLAHTRVHQLGTEEAKPQHD
ncbi:MAG: hypothetical protein OXG96_14285 [Acidobacteria bacterium]|nr:hypothetical protein [Acidobacteriota bacterium]